MCRALRGHRTSFATQGWRKTPSFPISIMTGCFPAAHLNDPATAEHTATSQADQPSICASGVDSLGQASRGFNQARHGTREEGGALEAPSSLPGNPQGRGGDRVNRAGPEPRTAHDCEFGWGFRHYREVGQPPKALPVRGLLRHPLGPHARAGRLSPPPAARQDCGGCRVPTDSR